MHVTSQAIEAKQLGLEGKGQNDLIESHVRTPVYGSKHAIFDTILMHQPDISSRGISEWIHKVTWRDSLSLTINAFDEVLRLSIDNAVIREACRRMIRNRYVLNDPFWQEFTRD